MTPDDQILGPSLDKILEGFEEFLAAAQRRIQAPTEWRFEHLVKLNELRGKILDFQFDLAMLREEVR
jgi:hypothetical protein